MTQPATDHRHSWHVEQQTNHRFCSACGKHDPFSPRCEDLPSSLWLYLKERFRGDSRTD